MTEEQLLADSIKNNTSAQEELYTRFSPKMLGVCYRFAKSKEDAEDMLQEAFIKVFTQLQQFKQEGSLEGWIRKIVVHTCINHLKKTKRFSESVDLIYANSIHIKEDMIPSIMQAKQLVECIRILPIGYRTVLNLYAIEGFSHKEIGDMLDIKESTSRSQYTRAKAMLEQILIKKNILQKPRKSNFGLTAIPN